MPLDFETAHLKSRTNAVFAHGFWRFGNGIRYIALHKMAFWPEKNAHKLLKSRTDLRKRAQKSGFQRRGGLKPRIWEHEPKFRHVWI